jgi:hypothetical protein
MSWSFFGVQWVQLRWKVIVCFVDIGENDDHHCLDVLFIIKLLCFIKNVYSVSFCFFAYFFFIAFQHEAFSMNCICFRNLNPGEILMHDASVICHTFFYVCDSVASFNIQQRKKIRSCICICLRKKNLVLLLFSSSCQRQCELSPSLVVRR